MTIQTGIFLIIITFAILFIFFLLLLKKHNKLIQRQNSMEMSLKIKDSELIQLDNLNLNVTNELRKSEEEKILIREKLKNLTEELETIKLHNSDLDEKLKDTINKKKSSEIRLGQISEQIAPFLSGFPYDPKRVRFLGSPIDCIVFEDDKIIILDIKTGNSQLNANQKKIRKLIQEGKVEFQTIQINDSGINVK